MSSEHRDDNGQAQTQQQHEATIPLPEQVVGSLASWKELLRDEERRCEEFGLGAAIISIGVPGANDSEVVGLVCSELQATDRVCVLRPGEYGVLSVPLEGARNGEDRANAIYAVLESAKLPAAVGWAMRHDGHGLFHAAAQADAAMLRSGPNRIDLT